LVVVVPDKCNECNTRQFQGRINHLYRCSRTPKCADCGERTDRSEVRHLYHCQAGPRSRNSEKIGSKETEDEDEVEVEDEGERRKSPAHKPPL
jgi:hypothetical protein